ncbi:5'-methylthioadenosine/S-adenosylhomocysteine nucleosidase [Echinimonas agarilytica]|uniref:5'-methylthioadenosine/S-adenosylhomocysteine nucleosidase n=1 Tax=Echinimonas agarilytica TaxID=1215918 RepID=A0AA41W4L3_9GAMM|nr:5'-methylthioadenosine/S-adenosylhomocysteine nucleosidase [Echinimonas agarilytica]MCM2678666.1 5'-methylthioadenosine/S-adenosylhomocysteine nucleosidase [Echinimonas agarilytica]
MRVGIIGAMEQEVAILREQIEQCETHHFAGSTFYSGKLLGHDVTLLQCGIGKVAAAIGTTLLLERFQPDCVINTGSAGGFDQALNVGDVVISSEVRYHDADVTAFGYEMGQLPSLPAAFAADSKLIATATQTIAQMNGVQAKTGLICTGDIFMSDPERVELCRSQFPTMIACEMEAAAIAHVCFKFDVPFVVIRALSDIAGKESSVSFDDFLEQAAAHSSQFILAMLPQLN